jgi:hypothetical protein
MLESIKRQNTTVTLRIVSILNECKGEVATVTVAFGRARITDELAEMVSQGLFC